MPDATVNAPATADLDRGTVTRTVRIAASREVVWTALTTPEHVAEWWGHPMRFPDGVKAGAIGKFEWSGGDFDVRIDRIDPPSHYAITWRFGPDMSEDVATNVLFELVEDGDGTLVTVTETGLDRRPDLASRRAAIEDSIDGWNNVLDRLSSHVAKLVG